MSSCLSPYIQRHMLDTSPLAFAAIFAQANVSTQVGCPFFQPSLFHSPYTRAKVP